jgi:glycosyltransferase involved in cell wall biosynthesis
MIKFSVLMSVYDKETASNFYQCLESLFCQTLPASEIVVVKDGFLTKDLDAILAIWGEKLPLRIVGYEQNRGLAHALNYGLQYCNYNYIARMDSDDICLENRFLEQLKFLGDNPESVMVGSNILEFYEQDTGIICLRERKYPVYLNKKSKELYKVTPAAHPTVIIKKDVLKKYKYNEHVGQNEDTDLWFRLLSDGNCINNINKPLLKFRITDKSFCRRNYSKAIVELKIHWINLLKFNGFSILLLYPVIRFLTRLLPLGIMKKLYFSKIRVNLLETFEGM